MAEAKRDQNSIPTLLGVSNADGITPVPIYADPATNRLLVNSTGAGSSGTEYTEGDTDSSITGQAALWEDSSDTLRAISMAKPLPVQPGTSATFPVSAASLPLPTGASTAANQSTANTALAAIQTAVETLDNAVSGNEFQVDVLTMPTTTTKEIRSATSSVTSVADTASSTTLLASNANRLGASIFNDSTVALYVKLGATASATSFTIKLAQDDYYEIPFGYTGIIDGIWASDASGSARITEFTA